MRYLGNKTKLIDKIDKFINHTIFDNKVVSFCDLFAGTGSVGSFFNKKYKIISNDYMYYSYVVNRGKLNYKNSKFEKLCEFYNIECLFEYLSEKIYKKEDGNDTDFCFMNYSEGGSDRKYLSIENALKTDRIRKDLEIWKIEELISEDEYYYLLMCLIESVSKVSNTTGVYGAYLKEYDSRSVKNMEFLKIQIDDYENQLNTVYNEDANQIIRRISGDIIYIDPPYTNQQYCDQYHVLETIAKYDNPTINGITGKRSGNKSSYSYKNKAEQIITDLIENIKFKHIIFSYNDNSIVPIEKIIDILKKNGIPETFKIEKIEYNRYKNHRTDNKNKNKLNECLFYIQK